MTSISLRTRSANAGRVLFLFLASCFALIPLLWALSTSLKPGNQVLAAVPKWIPSDPTLQHYADVLTKSNFPQYLLNSLIVAGLSTLLVLLVASHAAYAAARCPFPGRTVLMGALLLTLMIPVVVLVVPLYLLASSLHVLDTYGVLIIVYSAWQLPTAVWLLRGFFEDIPQELEEAATVDGASQWRTFYTIILPLSAPGLAAAALIVFVWVWNEFVIVLMLTSSDNMRLIPVGLYQYVGAFGTDWGGLTAAAIVAILPIVILFALLQKYIVSGLTSGSIKG